MKMLLTLVLTVILFIIGVITVFFNPMNPLAISFGMFLVAVAILNVAVQIYFPQQPQGTVELKVVKVKTAEKPKKRVRKSRKRKKK
jgi:NADH:ubiquinone oxidoreductase subunit K